MPQPYFFQAVFKDSPKHLCHRQTGLESSPKFKRHPPALALPGTPAPSAASTAQQINVTVAPRKRRASEKRWQRAGGDLARTLTEAGVH